MESVELLHSVVYKLNRYEFCYFTPQFIDKIKQYAGLYDVFKLKFFSKINVWTDPSETVVVETFDNKLIELCYIYYSHHDNFFDYEKTERTLIFVYESALKLLETETNMLSIEIVQMLLHGVTKNLPYTNYRGGSHDGKELWRMILPVSLCEFEEIMTLYNKKQFIECAKLIQVYVLENGSVPYLTWLQAVMEFEHKKTYQSFEKLVKTLDDFYGVNSSCEISKEVRCFYEMQVYAIRARTIQKVNLDSSSRCALRSYTGFPHIIQQHDVPSHFPCQKCFRHLYVTHTIVLNRTAYKGYMTMLYRAKEFNFTKLFHDYMALQNNDKKFQENVDFYESHKNFIHYSLKKIQDQETRYNIFVTVQLAYTATNRLYDSYQFHEFINSIYFSPEIYKKYGQQFQRLHNSFRYIEESLEKKKFAICREKSLIEDVCMICHEHLDNRCTPTIQCKICLKELGCVSCLLKWLIIPGNNCPNCRNVT
jgi:hypothetical protein